MKNALLAIAIVFTLLVGNSLAHDLDTMTCTLQHHTIDAASALVGTREATGKNDGPEVEKILGYVGLPKGNPYCMATVVYAYHLGAQRLKIKDVIPKYARVSMMWNYTNANPFKYKIITPVSLKLGTNKLEQADISIHSRSGGTESNFNGHTGVILEQIGNTMFSAVEGNTGLSKDQGEGDGICIKKRYISKMNGNLGLKGFIRIK